MEFVPQYRNLYTISNNIEVYEEQVLRTKKIPRYAVKFESGKENRIDAKFLYCVDFLTFTLKYPILFKPFFLWQLNSQFLHVQQNKHTPGEDRTYSSIFHVYKFVDKLKYPDAHGISGNIKGLFTQSEIETDQRKKTNIKANFRFRSV